MTDEQTEAITIHEVFLARRKAQGLPEERAYSMQDYDNQRLAMLGGCFSCGESLAAYNAYPAKRGYWACRGCLDEGYATVAEFEADEEDHQEEPEQPERVTYIRHKDRLLGVLASSLANFAHVKIELLEVALVVEGERYWFDLPHVLTALADGIYWDERGNWSEATDIEVRVL